MSDDRAAETAVQLAALRTDVKNIEKRADEDRGKLDKIYDLSKETAGDVKSIQVNFRDFNDRFSKHEERISELEDWRQTHSGAKGALAGLWGGLIAVIGAAGLYFVTFFHPGGK